MNGGLTLELVPIQSGSGQEQVPAMTEMTARVQVAEAMVALITEMAKAIVDSPALVTARYTLGEEVIALELRVSHSDLGQVIGKQGRTARSMRTILNAVSMRSRQRFSLDIQPLPEAAPGKPSESQTP